LVELKHKV